MLKPILNVVWALAAAFILFLNAAQSALASRELSSPDGKLVLQVEAVGAQLKLDATLDGKQLLNDSRLGLESDLPAITQLQIERIEDSMVDETWATIIGKCREVRNHYSSYLVHCRGADQAAAKFYVRFRCYDDGFAFRYEIPEQAGVEEVKLQADSAEIRVPGDYTFWSYNGEQHNLGPLKRSDNAVPKSIRPPMVIRTTSDQYLAILESKIVDQAPFQIAAPEDARRLTFSMSASQQKVPFVSSWRTFIVGRRAGDLIESNLVANLNDSCKIADASWVRPGKSLWDWRVWGYQTEDGFQYDLDTRSHVRFIDFAAENNIQYLLIDADWYGDEFSDDSDPTTTNEKIDIEKCMAHAKKRGVGVILYLNDIGAKKFGLERVLKQFSAWGAAGVKYGFMTGNALEKRKHTQKVVELCAKYQLIVIFHDNPIVPNGEERPWPNLVGREFCHAQADAKRSYFPETAVTSPFINMLTGPLDYTDGWFSLHSALESRVKVFEDIPGTVAAETAKLIVTYSGLRVLPDAPEEYLKKQDLFECVRQLPPRFDSYQVLSGEIGEYLSVARQTGEDWFVGSLTNREERELEVVFDFLAAGATYEATFYEDARESHFQTSREAYSVRRQTVQSGDVAKVWLAPGGGNSIHLKRIE